MKIILRLDMTSYATFKDACGGVNLNLQWWQLLLQQGPVYEVIVPISDGYSTI